jgi:hypothetical protein
VSEISYRRDESNISLPKKDPSLRKVETLRIPVTAEEKRGIMDAALATDGEFARWARRVLIAAADSYRHSAGGQMERPKAKGTEAKKNVVSSKRVLERR